MSADAVLWLTWAMIGLALELLGLIKPRDRWRPLTQVIRWYVPWYVALPFFAWLLWHFTLTFGSHPMT